MAFSPRNIVGRLIKKRLTKGGSRAPQDPPPPATPLQYGCKFLKDGGQISVQVTGKRRNKGTGLEIPATYSFYHKKPSKVKKLIELIIDTQDRVEVN